MKDEQAGCDKADPYKNARSCTGLFYHTPITLHSPLCNIALTY
jgi:hypothetical protein